MKVFALVLTAIILIGCAEPSISSSADNSTGRFQIHQHPQAPTDTFLLDTATGDVWRQGLIEGSNTFGWVLMEKEGIGIWDLQPDGSLGRVQPEQDWFTRNAPNQEVIIVPLTEERRQQLDGIVQQMIANNESERNIQLVVDDFKQKYGSSSPGATRVGGEEK